MALNCALREKFNDGSALLVYLIPNAMPQDDKIFFSQKLHHMKTHYTSSYLHSEIPSLENQ